MIYGIVVEKVSCFQVEANCPEAAKEKAKLFLENINIDDMEELELYSDGWKITDIEAIEP